jgi:toxin ParE1/3/4
MRSFKIDDIARQEFDDEAAWYENERAGLGHEFIAEIDLVLARIEQRDEFVTAPVAKYKTFVVRREFVHRFPYLVMFVENDTLRRVIMIRRSDSDPALWRSRI